MFTGIIRHVGVIKEIRHSSRGARLLLQLKTTFSGVSDGSSLSVSGVCLTVAKKVGRKIWFDVMLETLQKTILGDLKENDTVNVEPSLRLGDEVGGHFVFGHVDGIATIEQIRADGNSRLLTVRPPKELMRYMAPQGSVAINGVSLTVARVRKTDFIVSLVDYTLVHTTLKHLSKGAKVNIECDMLAKYCMSHEKQRP